MDAEGKLVCNERIKTDVRDIGRFFERMEAKDNKIKVTMEATGFYFWIYDVIKERKHDVTVVHPVGIKGRVKKRTKTDKNDAYMPARLLRLGELEGICVPSEEMRELRDLTRYRESPVRKKGDLKREIISSLDRHGVKMPAEFKTDFSDKYIAYVRSLGIFIVNDELDLLEATMEKLEKVEARIEERCKGDKDVNLMMTMPGIGMVTASVLKAEIGDIERFGSAKNLATCAGLTPSRSRSGEKEWFGPTGHGNDRIKHVLIEATLSHVHRKNDTKIRDFYRKKEGPLGENKAIVAAARKMLEAIYFMLLRQETYHAH